MAYKTQTERTHDLLLDRASAAEERAKRAEVLATDALECAHKAIDERDEALKALETLRNGLKVNGLPPAADPKPGTSTGLAPA